MKNIPELDGLRGLGAVLVVVFHWDPTHVFWAWSFVPMFFVLSAFLISRIILEDLLAGQFSVGRFFMRRILRIWPVYYAALAAILVYYLLVQGSAFFGTPHFTDWRISLVYLQFTQQYVGHLGNPWFIYDFLPGMQPLWTLAIEEQFYVLLPFALILFLPRLGLSGLAWACLGIAVIAPAMRLIGFPPTLLLTQLDSLALGVLLAIITTVHAHRSDRRHHHLMVGGYTAALVGASLAMLPYLIDGYRALTPAHNPLVQPVLWSCAGLFFFGLIGLITIFPDNRMTAVLRSRPLVYAGSVSYALYVFHAPVLTFIAPRIYRLCGPELRWLAVAVTVLLLWGLVHASRELLERPILRLKHRYASGSRSPGP